VLTVDDRLAEEQPDLVVRLIETIKRAGDWAEAHPDETRRFVAREIGASEETVAIANGPDLHRHLGLGLDPVLIDAIAHYKDFLRDWGFLAGDFDLNAWVDRRAFDALDTRAVA
jgi:ABC-type nitrate/sulfonate/bicarbonate transport system substrate-binding protein